jgi:hypothetical protein
MSDPAAVNQPSEQSVGSHALFGSASARAALSLEAENFAIRAKLMMQRARMIVQDDRVDAIALLKARRISFCDHLNRYQRFKHSQIFDPIVVHAPASSRIVARSMKVDCIALGDTFSAYHNRWLGLTKGDWASYKRDMFVTTEMMMTNVDAELRAIRQLLMISNIYKVHLS